MLVRVEPAHSHRHVAPIRSVGIAYGKVNSRLRPRRKQRVGSVKLDRGTVEVRRIKMAVAREINRTEIGMEVLKG